MPDPKEELGEPKMDPRNREDVDEMPGTFIDSSHNMPGDQPEDDTPPSKTLADGTDESDEPDD